MRQALSISGLFVMGSLLGFLGISNIDAGIKGPQTVTLQIQGMTCGACVKEVRAALQKVPGVNTVEIQMGTKWFFFSDYADARALVAIDPEVVAPEELIPAVESASTALSTYKARLIRDN